jgi:hypothetical protein
MSVSDKLMYFIGGRRSQGISPIKKGEVPFFIYKIHNLGGTAESFVPLDNGSFLFGKLGEK